MKPRRRELLKMRSRRSAMAMSIGGVRRAAPILGPPSPSVLTGLTRCPISVSQSSQSSLFSLLLSWNQDQRMPLRVQGSGSKAFIGFTPALWTRLCRANPHAEPARCTANICPDRPNEVSHFSQSSPVSPVCFPRTYLKP